MFKDNSLVVWKEINLRKSNKNVEESALHEIEILSLLNHDNIVTYYNHYIDDESLFIEMEYANG